MPSMPMRLSPLALAAALFLVAATAHAEDVAAPGTPPETGSARYTMLPAPGGFVRLDTETGLVSQCRRETAATDAAWRCAAVSEAEMTRPDRIDALVARTDALSNALTALAARIATLEKQATAKEAPNAAEADAAPSAAPSAEASAKSSFADEALRRVALLLARVRGAPATGAAQPSAAP